MKRDIYRLEYIFPKVALERLWRKISTEQGLSEWILGNVRIDPENEVTFVWEDGEEVHAKMRILESGHRVQFRWHELPGVYFELTINQSEITGDTILNVFDSAEPHEVSSNKEIWEIQIHRLRTALGIRS